MDTTTEIELATASVLDRINKGVALSAVLKDLVHVPRTPSTGVVHLPDRNPLSVEQVAALEGLIADIQHGIKVTPAERRELTRSEIEVLISERESLDLARKAIDARLADQKIAAFNHLDVELERSDGFDRDTVDVDKDGHYIASGKIPAPGHVKGFVRQLRQGSPSVTAESLRAVVDMDEDVPDGFTHEDWKACTTPVRVLDELKVAAHMRKHPTVMVEALRRAIVPGASTTAHTLG